MAAIMNDGQVDETAIAKALASTTMWMLPEYTEIEPQPTWVGVEMEKNNATLFNGLPIGFRACAGDDDITLYDAQGNVLNDSWSTNGT